ncbi:glutamine--fructose-6-phosphate transaminase (isomerizing) [uncultured Anaerococcus sp.]|uniref:glutamine--fructose-6-phosphate transaminase (isomerizing) n=1 Tax=uncultured Anaerococcus sp. TaxID=293428 RepID=UPI0025F24612|nr:glutamine--fructose-6-phosphate transaminase (isomerizing) [uncultured Anaerococcus sp.]
MCGIVCYKGSLDAKDIILDGLEKLEYRGYDSSGIAIIKDSKLEIHKEKGPILSLKEEIAGKDLSSHIGIGHIRWATHGEASKENAHPHTSADGKIAIVHNGIIENYKDLKDELAKEGYSFKSQTDTELVAILLGKFYDGDLLKALIKVRSMIEGSFAIGAISEDEPDRLVGIRKDSPMVLGLMDDGFILASDSPSFIKYTNKLIYLENEDIIDIKGDSYKIYDKDLKEVAREVKTTSFGANDASKEDYDHFMLKEIEEQADVIGRLAEAHLDKEGLKVKSKVFSEEEIKSFNKIYIVACGTAYNAGLVGKALFEKYLRIPVTCDLASEFRYSDPLVDENTLVIFLSQSGETADTLKALDLAKSLGAMTLAITNVRESSIDREAERTIYTEAGPEIAVASTKAYTSQLLNLYILGLEFNEVLEKFDDKEIIEEIFALPQKIKNIIDRKEELKYFANELKDKEHLFYLARGLDYQTAIEASLKVKEISYIHSEAFASGELKHGTIALIEDGTPVIGILSQKDLLDKALSNLEEVKARKAEVFTITNLKDKRISDIGVASFIFDETLDILAPILSVVPCQILAYYTSLAKGLNVDKPRNLAKSVTVE